MHLLGKINLQKKVEIMTLGEKIKTLRKGKYTQEELAYRVGVHVNTLIRWEHGDSTPTTDKLKILADALGTTPSWLLDNTDDLQQASIVTLKSNEEDSPYTQTQTTNKGMLIYNLGNGKSIELPPTEDSYNFLREIALSTIQAATA